MANDDIAPETKYLNEWNLVWNEQDVEKNPIV